MNEQKDAHEQTNPDSEQMSTNQGTEDQVDEVTEQAVPSDEAGQTDTSDDLAAELEKAQEEVANLKDAYLRAKAEEDNVRRRAEKEVANSRKFAVEGFAKELLQVRDSLKLALAVELADDADETVKGIHEGVQITLKQLDTAFTKYSLAEVAPEVGDKLDPNEHQAMSIVESDAAESGHIINVIQVGFKLHDRLLRPAMVVVAK